jgi:uncharacterized protein YutE (UPF0331/DUF86 family)
MALEFTDELREKINAEIQNVEIALNNLKEAVERDERSVIILAAEATFLHNVYNGIENILSQILKAKNIKIPRTSTWHKDLLDVAETKGIISKNMSDELYEYLAFRHFFVHAYGFMIEDTKMEPLAENIEDIWTRFLAEIEFEK